MASVIDDPGGRRRIQFVAPDGKRKTIRLGKIDRRGAESISRHVEALLSAKVSGQPLARETATWVAELADGMKAKLAAVGLTERSSQATLQAFLEEYILSRGDVKPATIEIWRQPCRNLITFFGADQAIRGITPGNADQFKRWLLTQPLAPSTIAKRLAFARTFFHVALRHKLIDENPLVEVRVPIGDVSARQRFVGRETVQRLMDVASPTWRTIIGLARFGGLRTPSETLSLEWSHVDWANDRITVLSPKTERYDGQGSRTIPLFPELKVHLLEAFELAEPGQKHVVGGDYLARALTPKGWAALNLRTGFLRLLRRAGIAPWPRPFHYLRSSRETELLEEFPLHVVAKWMGHDAKISVKHYAQVTDAHFTRAVGGGAKSGA